MIKPSDLDFFLDRKGDIKLGSGKDFIIYDDEVTLPLVSARMSRLYEHLRSGVPVMFITSDLYFESNSEQKVKRTQLTKDIKDAGLSFTKIAGAWQDPDRFLTYETSFLVTAYNSNTEEIMDLDEFTKLAKEWCLKYKQTSTIVGKYNEQTHTYDFNMYGYIYDDEANRDKVIDTYISTFVDIKFDTPENIEKFYYDYKDEQKRINDKYQDYGFGYSKTKKGSKVGFSLRDKNETEFAKKRKTYVQANFPKIRTFSDRIDNNKEKNMYSIELKEQNKDNKFSTKIIAMERGKKKWNTEQ